MKVHCSVLAEEAISAAIQDYYDRQGIDKKVMKCDGCCEHCGH